MGVVGVGVMGSNHARVFAGPRGVQLVGVADPDSEQRELVTRVLDALRSIVSMRCCNWGRRGFDRGADAPASKSRSPASRADYAAIEKPTPLRRRGPRNYRSRTPRRVALMVGHVERFNPAVQAIKEAIRNEDILSIAITRVGPFPAHVECRHRRRPCRARHRFDPLVHRFRHRRVQPQLSSAVAEREDIALLQFRTASGVLAHINTNWLTPFKARNVTIATRGKYVMGDLLTREVTECFGFQPDGSYSMRHLSVGYEEPLRAELNAFVTAIREGKTPAVSGEEAVASLEIAIRCLEPRPVATPMHQRKGPRRVVG